MEVEPMQDSFPAAVALDRHYDNKKLAAEVRALRESPWRAQRSVGQQGMIKKSAVDWTILSLRSAGGDPDRTDAGGAGLVEHAETPHLSDAPYLNEVLREFPAQLLAARLMALGAGARVGEHRDSKCGLPWGLVRLHVPIITNPGALVVIAGTEFHWNAGQLWFGDFNRPHYVSNDGDESRIHLVLDCLVSKEILALLPPFDDALVAREPVPLTTASRCRFQLPARFAEWSEEEPIAGADDTLDAEIGDDLVLYLEGKPRFGLVHVGGAEFRLAGWSEERTLQVDLEGADPSVCFRTRFGREVIESTWPAIRL
jgi:hypothetical protein